MGSLSVDYITQNYNNSTVRKSKSKGKFWMGHRVRTMSLLYEPYIISQTVKGVCVTLAYFWS